MVTTLAIVLAFWVRRRSTINSRESILDPSQERIVILGASTTDGIGAAIASRCLDRGAHRIMLVARRKQSLYEVKAALVAAQTTQSGRKRAEQIELVVANCSRNDDILHLEAAITHDFGGVDTLYIVFGAICTQPMLAIAGLDPLIGATSPQVSAQSLLEVRKAVQQSSDANLLGTALVLTALVPRLQTNSKSPYVAIINSVAGLIAAPTRALYCATKSAQMMLVLGMALECEAQAKVEGYSNVRFVVISPAAVQTSFNKRLSLGSDMGSKSARYPVGKALTSEQVAIATVQSVADNKTGIIPLPHTYFYIWLLAPFLPGMLSRGAHKFYDY
ncbi:hypothetical protein MVES1_002222 [Malassezia vespertilionis]|uniref:uncharacterized protein n=1 Tax=Malassezia vespertilionis TaxID=2020962 RepID=UPI0024B112DD|nr:uncharacterized protein MVES1_002222 [Malassezia vespertilionis]WFD06867.1 hypothetical protein MVES1_002222 [Malassezia vespertilionis]